jgi:tRNA dimethylallyltransferase
MDIGTAKLMPEDRLVPHHVIDVVDPGEAYSAALFQDDARAAIIDIFSRELTPVVAGGTGFYVRAALDDYNFPAGEQVSNPIREKYTQYLNEHGAMELWNRLKEADPMSANAIHPNNTKRVIRAFELLAEGKSYAQQLQNLHEIKAKYDTIYIGIDVERDKLREKIDKRVDIMREMGLVEEVKSLLNLGFESALTAPQAIGYKEIVAAFNDQYTLDVAFDQIKTATKRYAKRQRSWFRQDKRINWLDATDKNIEELLAQALNIINKTSL